MKQTTLHTTLAQIAEEAAPTAEIDLWTGLHQHLASESHFKGDASMNTTTKLTPRRAALATLIAFALLLGLFATPPGRALAQTVLQFFTRAGSDQLPVQSAPAPTDAPRDKSLVEAESLAGFSVLTPGTLPEGLSFYGASYDDGLKAVVQQFGYSPEDIRFSLRQQPFTTSETCTLCGLVGASAPVQPVTVGSAPAEYTEGVWELTDAGPVWRNDEYLKTLRWQKDGMAFELIYMGTELDRDALVALAASVK